MHCANATGLMTNMVRASLETAGNRDGRCLREGLICAKAQRVFRLLQLELSDRCAACRS